MADWKQITARIRRARTSKDPAGQLTNLFSKTRDAMVAFELARYFESAGNPGDAARWYLTAAERFRRSDWKTKAQESATRLGATVAAEIPAAGTSEPGTETSQLSEIKPAVNEEHTADGGQADIAVEAEPIATVEEQPKTAPASRGSDKKHRRGRRGGRERGHGGGRRGRDQGGISNRESRPPASQGSRDVEEESVVSGRSVPSRSHKPSSDVSAPSLRGRSGDPGLSSRLSQLEMSFRRLLSCQPVKLEEGSSAPAGPGVWVLTDSDLSTYYYVEACQTLRVAIPNLLRNGTVRRGDSIKPQLADHLGIPEGRVSKYLAEHCVVRWLQMDEGASHFAHFLVAVLHPALNE